MLKGFEITESYGFYARWLPTASDAAADLEATTARFDGSVPELLLQQAREGIKALRGVEDTGGGVYVQLSLDEAEELRRTQEGPRFVDYTYWEPPLVTPAVLDFVLGMRGGDHSRALKLMGWFGDLGLKIADKVPPLLSPARPAVLWVVWPEHFWAEVLLLQRTHWLHRFLLETPNLSGDVVSKRFSAFETEWPEGLSLPWCQPWVPTPIGLLVGENNPFLFLWDELARLVNYGSARHPKLEPIFFDREGRVPRPGLAKVNFFGVLWEMMRGRVLEERLPRPCEVCGSPVRAKRSTRRYCDRPACAKAAQRRARVAKGG